MFFLFLRHYIFNCGELSQIFLRFFWRHMQAARLKVDATRKTSTVASALRNWQRRARNRRGPLTNLAKTLKVTVDKLRSMMRKGPRKTMKRCSGVADVLKKGMKRFRCATKAVKRLRKPAVHAEELGMLISPRTIQRLLAGMRAEHRSLVRAHWKQWHRDHPNTPPTAAEFERWSRFSQSW